MKNYLFALLASLTVFNLATKGAEDVPTMHIVSFGSSVRSIPIRNIDRIRFTGNDNPDEIAVQMKGHSGATYIYIPSIVRIYFTGGTTNIISPLLLKEKEKSTKRIEDGKVVIDNNQSLYDLNGNRIKAKKQ